MHTHDLSVLTSDELLVSLKECVAREHVITIEVLARLAELARRRLHVDEACGKLRAFCIEELGYSEYEAGKRVTAAYTLREYPLALEMLRKRQLCMSTLLMLRPVLTPENHRERLEAAAGKSCEKIKLLIATWAPKPLVKTSVLRVKVDDRPALFDAKVKQRIAQQVVTEEPHIPQVALPPPPRAPMPVPLDSEHYKIQITIDAESYAELMKLRDLVRHSVPDGDLAKVISHAVKAQRKAVEKRKFGRSDKPKQLTLTQGETRAPDKSRAPSAQTKREVSERDGDRCCYVSKSGKRCTETGMLEFDHKVMRSRGGETSTANLRLYCRTHNAARNFTEMRHIAHNAKADTATEKERQTR